jgi:hypothetical protein
MNNLAASITQRVQSNDLEHQSKTFISFDHQRSNQKMMNEKNHLIDQ